jgi:hypothetical protein
VSKGQLWKKTPPESFNADRDYSPINGDVLLLFRDAGSARRDLLVGLRDGYHGIGGPFAMPTRVERRTVNLSAYPDLVVIYLGMRVNRVVGIKTLLGFGPKISSSAAAQPDGLLRHETIIYSLFPMHVGKRQYWRDGNSLLEWTRSDPHRQWWQSLLKDSGGTGFWHETYFRRGGIEAIYDDVPENIRLMAFAPVVPARGPMFGAAARAEKEFGERPVLSEEELYGEPEK